MFTIGSQVYIISTQSTAQPVVVPALVVEVVVRTTCDGERKSYVLDLGSGEPRSIKAEAVFGDIDSVKVELHRRSGLIIDAILEKAKTDADLLVR